LWTGGLAGVITGLRGRRVESETLPEQGVRMWLRNAVVGVIVFGIVEGIISVLMGISVVALSENLLIGVIAVLFLSVVGLIMLIIPFLVYGGLDTIKHITVRFLLSRSEHLPWNLSSFLDYASDKVFLYKVGGGYIFIHRLLMEHFATLYGSSDSGMD